MTSRLLLHWIARIVHSRMTLAMCVAWGLMLIASACAGAADRRPNVVVILTDDQGWGDLSLNGNQNLATPNLDRLGRNGVRFDRFFVSPVCAPTRAEFLTGRYHPRCGVVGVTEGKERLNLDERTMADHFKAAGYRTAAFGKWHNGTQYPYHPIARGFEEFYGYCSGHWGDYFSPELDHNGKQTKGEGYLVEDFTNRAISFIEQNADEEFFVYLPLPTPHSPMQVPDQYWDRVKNRTIQQKATLQDKEDVEFTRAALAMVECIDDNVGRLMTRLQELSLTEDTIVVFFCDNGPNSHRWNGGMKGKKASTDEGGVRSPLFISWPGQIKAGRLVLQICAVIDLLPTLSDLAQVPLVGGKPLDGVSLEPLISGRAGALSDRMIFSHFNGRVSVRTQHYRLDHTGKVYDMLLDPAQESPANDRLPTVVSELKAHVAAWKSNVLVTDPKTRPFTVGHPDFPISTLPARDGSPQGGVQRSAKAPNCSYFTNWKTAQDSASWDIDVLAAGNFEVDVYYACKSTSVGTELSAEMKSKRVSATILEPNDPPAVGPEHDRVPRVTQSPLKDFKPLTLGKLYLPEGEGKLTLRTTKAVGTETLDIRRVVLRRVK